MKDVTHTSLKAGTILKNSFFLLSARVVDGITQLVTLTIIVRFLGMEMFGDYAFVVTVSFFLALMIPFGTGNIFIREIAKEKGKTGEYITEVLVIRLAMTTVVIALVLLLQAVFSFSPFIVQGLYIMTLANIIFVIGRTFEEVYIAHERMSFILYITVSYRIVLFAVIYSAYYYRCNHIYIYIAFLTAYMFRAFLSFMMCKKYFIPRFHMGIFSNLGYFIKESLPLFGSMFLRQLNIRINVFFLRAIASSAELGIFYAPHRVVMNLQTVPDSITWAILPQLTRVANESKEQLAYYFERFFKYFLAASIFITILCMIWAKDIIVLLFSSEFIKATTCFKVLSWSFMAVLLNSLLSIFLIVTNNQKKIIAANIVGLLINVLLAVVLIPSYGSLGAALATVISHIVTASVMLFSLSLVLNIKSVYFIIVKLICISIVSMLFSIKVLAGYKIIATISFVFLFVGFMFLFYITTKEEILYLFRFVKNRLKPKLYRQKI